MGWIQAKNTKEFSQIQLKQCIENHGNCIAYSRKLPFDSILHMSACQLCYCSSVCNTVKRITHSGHNCYEPYPMNGSCLALTKYTLRAGAEFASTHKLTIILGNKKLRMCVGKFFVLRCWTDTFNRRFSGEIASHAVNRFSQ